MREDFENVKMQIRINEIATYLLGNSNRGMFKYPGEKTASIKIYPQTQSFYDYGRNRGGDVVALWAHVRNCDNWTALQEITAVFNISTDLNEIGRKGIIKRIERQEKEQRAHKQVEKKKQKQWVAQVERLKEQEKLYNDLLESPHIQPFSNIWCVVISLKQMVSYRLDSLCGITD